jgi:sugar O-acyltransferase (sialic acid O-acetyltransferase NeuD family)
VTTAVFIFGAGPQGRVLLDILRSGSAAAVGGFLEDRTDLIGTTVAGLPVLDASAWLAGGPHAATVVIAIGNNLMRMAAGQRVAGAGYALHTAKHRSATVAGDVEIGQGTVLCMQAAVGTGCKLGINVVINTGATLDHDNVVQDGAYLSPGVHSAGNVHVGRNAFVGAGAILLPGVRIGDDAIVGAGSVVIDDIPSKSLSYGTPARMHRVVDGSVDWPRILGGRGR